MVSRVECHPCVIFAADVAGSSTFMRRDEQGTLAQLGGARALQLQLALVGRLTRGQRQELVDRLKAQSNAEASVEVLESAGNQARACPHCKSQRLVRNGMADGLTLHRAAEFLGVAPSTAFRWRHRFLRVPRGVKPTSLAGVTEMDETYFLESYKGRNVVGRATRKRGGRAARRGLSREQIPVLVAHDRSGVTTDHVLTDTRKAAVMALLKPLLPTDAAVCSDGAGSISQATKELGLEHHAVLTSSGRHTVGAWHIQNLTRTTHASRPGCAASTAWPRTTWRTTSAGFAPSTACLATPHDPYSCLLWRSAADNVLS